ncbi:U2 small nuclear ribonucleoprotein B'' isoform X2 [Nymphaea colorata]|uniref:U2 small nuclear ribonucleoprotein B'' isoform X2 n=1 Tax=Nymphaea colorata TaxID=210225 RepID=UPI00214ED32D|nr:U2 small nuclear ribonucleoprotein B'' isoform X2 [Nymphaea colorata]
MDPNSAHAVAMAAMASHHQLKPPGILHPGPLGPPPGVSGLPPPAVDPISPVMQPGRRGPLDLDPHLHHQQQQLAGYFPNPYQEPIKTIFISGLPDDVKPREIHNLFRRRYGFESCQLKYTGRGDQVVAFATFFDHQSAMAAMEALNGTIFDPLTGGTLHIELARSNSRTKRPRGSSAYTVIDKRIKDSKGAEDDWGNDDGGSDDPSSMNNTSSSNKSGLPSAQSGEATGNLANFQDNSATVADKPALGEAAPCSTLFIANLGPTCTEQELTAVLSKYPGFQVLKLRSKGGMPVAFADFQDVSCSTEALRSLQGCLLASSDRGGMHIEYAKSKMRKTR